MNQRFFSETLLALFDQALDLPDREREAFVAGDNVPQALKTDLRFLLRASAQSQVLDGQPNRLIADALPAPVRTGSRIGPYELIRLIGEGGMASVWLGERKDDFAHQVAVKCLKTGLDTPTVRAYFLREQQVLAQLQHPNIAALYDAGLTTDGVPYIIMEYVGDALPLTHYCDERRLTIPQRLALFRKTCDAVQYAHQNLVVHRDLKPSNILVGKNGEPKLLDFGIAKLLGGSAAHATHTGLKPLTPEYAAPEQFQNGRITAATDVYALGLILYELLCGVKAQTWDEVRHQPVTLSDPPSGAIQRLRKQGAERERSQSRLKNRSTHYDALKNTLRGDLDTIALHALQEEPQRRYASVAELGEDVSRYLGNVPIKARKTSFAYRSSKFLRRNRIPMTLGASVACILIAATGISIRQTMLARMEAARAQTEALRSTATKRFLVDLLEISDTGVARERLPNVAQLLKDGANRIENELHDAPALKSELLLLLGRVHSNLGIYDEAKRLLLQANALTTRYARENDSAWLNARGELANLLYRLSEYDRGLSLIRVATARYLRAGGAKDEHYAQALMVEALLLDRKGLKQEQVDKLAETAAILRPLADKRALLEQALLELGLAYAYLGDHAQAESLLRRIHDERLKRYGNQHAKFSEAAAYLGYALVFQGKHAQAVALLKQAVDIDEKIFELPSRQLLNSYLYLGIAYTQQGNLPDAARYLEKTQGLEALKGPRRAYFEATVEQTGLPYLFEVYIYRGEFAKAEKLVPKYRHLTEKYYGKSSNRMLIFLRTLGNLHWQQGKLADARAQFLEGKKIADHMPKATYDEAQQAFTLLNLSMIDNLLGLPSAASYAERALSLLNRYYPPHHQYVVRTQFELLPHKDLAGQLALLASISAHIGLTYFDPIVRGEYWDHMAQAQKEQGNAAWAMADWKRARDVFARSNYPVLLTRAAEIDREIAVLEKSATQARH